MIVFLLYDESNKLKLKINFLISMIVSTIQSANFVYRSFIAEVGTR